MTFFGAFYIMTRIDLQIAMVAVLLLPVYYLAMKLIGRRIRPIASDWVHAWSRMFSLAEENLSLLLYAMLMTRPIAGLANVYGQIQQTRGAAERLLGFFAEQPEPTETALPPLKQVKGHIRFEKVSFAYPGHPQNMLALDTERGHP